MTWSDIHRRLDGWEGDITDMLQDLLDHNGDIDTPLADSIVLPGDSCHEATVLDDGASGFYTACECVMDMDVGPDGSSQITPSEKSPG